MWCKEDWESGPEPLSVAFFKAPSGIQNSILMDWLLWLTGALSVQLVNSGWYCGVVLKKLLCHKCLHVYGSTIADGSCSINAPGRYNGVMLRTQWSYSGENTWTMGELLPQKTSFNLTPWREQWKVTRRQNEGSHGGWNSKPKKKPGAGESKVTAAG